MFVSLCQKGIKTKRVAVHFLWQCVLYKIICDICMRGGSQKTTVYGNSLDRVNAMPCTGSMKTDIVCTQYENIRMSACAG